MGSQRAPEHEDAQQQCQVDPSSLPVHFTNSVQFYCSPEELIMEFGTRSVENPELSEPRVRIVTTLPHAKRMLQALVRVIKAHEEAFGAIEENPQKRLKRAAMSGDAEEPSDEE